jgi:sulfatase maturation enzyme AslB (radical SAM superfamily)
MGDTRLDTKDIPQLINYIDSITKAKEDPMIGFHGGEPFLYTKQMIEIMDYFIATRANPRFSILTNGTLLKRNEKFLNRYGKYLNISISYDFTKMKDNRGYGVDIEDILRLLDKYNCKTAQLQWVVDMRDKECFNMEVLKRITDLYKVFHIGMLTLIPLRHIRGKTKFRNIMDSVDVQDFMRGFLQFIQMLYVLKIKVSIDGHSHGINKAYFNNHKQIILSPDGYIYPEFDFLDYKVKDARIGNWKDMKLNRLTNADAFLSPVSCHSCSQFYNCGIKYLYKLFDETPSGECEKFYTYQEAIVAHYDRLSKYDNLIQAVK